MLSPRNISAILGFDNAPGAYYQGAAAVAPGAASMTAAVMFYLNDAIANGATQTLWHNLDQGNNRGWGIFLEGNVQRSHIQLTTTLGDGVGQNPVTVDLGPGPIGKLGLIHLVADNNANERRIYYNGSLVHAQALALPTQGSALQPVVGELVGVGAPAQSCEVVGVGYLDSAMADVAAATHFRACFRGGNFARPDESLGSTDWTNRWDAREGAVVLGAGGTTAGGDLLTLPAPAASWTPSAGTDALTRVGALNADVITCPPWGYTDAQSGGGGGADTFIQTFVDADLVANILTVNHNLNSNPVSVVVVDNNGAQIVPDDVTVVTANQITVDLTSFAPIAGTWRLIVIGQ